MLLSDAVKSWSIKNESLAYFSTTCVCDLLYQNEEYPHMWQMQITTTKLYYSSFHFQQYDSWTDEACLAGVDDARGLTCMSALAVDEAHSAGVDGAHGLTGMSAIAVDEAHSAGVDGARELTGWSAVAVDEARSAGVVGAPALTW